MTEYADGDSMLAVIDMQRVFAAPDSPWATPRYAQAAARVPISEPNHRRRRQRWH